MKIVHSYWSKPTNMTGTRFNEKFSGGWRHKKYEYMSWALSCLTHKKYYENIELVTDLAGKTILVDKLKLPYNSIRIELEKLKNIPSQLWALGKLFAYNLQEEPFLHVDGDVYIWEKYSDAIENAELVAQHVDYKEDDYKFAISHLKEHNISIPIVLLKDFVMLGRFKASNAGIIGGKNIGFFKTYVKEALRFINSNDGQSEQAIIGSSYAIIYEQYLYSAMARKENLKIDHLFEDKELNLMDLLNFMNKYNKNKFVHLFSTSKLFSEYCRELEHQLLLDYPEYHHRIISLFCDE